MARFLALLTITAVAVWAFQHFTGVEPRPREDVLVKLAHEEWGPGACYEGELKWPCVLVVDIRLDDVTLASSSDGERAYRACYSLELHFESTQWDATQGVAQEPRTYIASDEPTALCSRVEYFMGDEEDVSSWFFQPEEDSWDSRLAEALARTLCAQAAPGRYACPGPV